MQSLPKGMRFGFTALVLTGLMGAASWCAPPVRLSPQPQPSPPPRLQHQRPQAAEPEVGSSAGSHRADHRVTRADHGLARTNHRLAWTDGWLTRTGSWRRAWRYG